MGKCDDIPELLKLLRRLGVYQAQIEAELAKGEKANQAKIAKAFAAGREYARDAAPYCHSSRNPPCSLAAKEPALGAVLLLKNPVRH